MLFTRRSALVVLAALTPRDTVCRRWLRRRRTPTTSSCWLGGSKPTATSRARGPRSSAPRPPIRSRPRFAPRSPSLHLRRNERAEAEKAAKAALALDEKNVEANRALGLIYAAAVDASSERSRARRRPRTCATRSPISSAPPPASTVTADADALLHAGAPLHPRRHAGQSRAVADARAQPESQLGAGPARDGAGLRGGEGSEERDRHARRDRRRRAARGIRAGAVSGGRRSADGRRGQLHAGAGRAAGEPRAEGPAHRRAARGQGVRPRGRLRRRRAQAASERAGLPAAAGPRAVRLPAIAAAGSRCSSRR